MGLDVSNGDVKAVFLVWLMSGVVDYYAMVLEGLGLPMSRDAAASGPREWVQKYIRNTL